MIYIGFDFTPPLHITSPTHVKMNVGGIVQPGVNYHVQLVKDAPVHALFRVQAQVEGHPLQDV